MQTLLYDKEVLVKEQLHHNCN